MDLFAWLWNSLAPLWSASFWWMPVVGLVLGVVFGTFQDMDVFAHFVLATIGVVCGFLWLPLVLFVVPLVLVVLGAHHGAVFVRDWLADAPRRKRARESRKQKAAAEKKAAAPDSMVMESPDLYQKDDLR